MILLHFGARGKRNFDFLMTLTVTVTVTETSSVLVESSPRDSLLIAKTHYCTLPNHTKLAHVFLSRKKLSDGNVHTKQQI